MRRTLASPNLAISSNSPAAMRGEVLSASMRTANRRKRLSSAMTVKSLVSDASATLEDQVGGDREAQGHDHQDEGDGAAERPVGLLGELIVDQGRHHLEQRPAQQERRGIGVHRQDEGEDGAEI